MNDNWIIELYNRRDETAISETEKCYGKTLRSIAYNILKSDSDSEECVTDVYLKLWNMIPPLWPESLKAYACKTARSFALMKLRQLHAKKHDISLSVSFAELENIIPDRSIDENSGYELKEILNSFLGELEHDARVIFLRKYWFFDSVKEICHRYGFSESKVKSSLRSTREKLRKYLAEKGVYL